MRSAKEIIDTVAAREGLVTPVCDHFPLSPKFVTKCLQERDAEVMRTFGIAPELLAPPKEAEASCTH